MKTLHGTISHLARTLNVPYHTVYGYVRGTRRPENIETAQRLAKVTGCGTDSEILAWLSKDPALIAPMVEAWAARQYGDTRS